MGTYLGLKINENVGIDGQANYMNKTNKVINGELNDGGEKLRKWQKKDSNFELIMAAVQRCKQLTNGAVPRLNADTKKRRNTYIALEEITSGLVTYRDNPNNDED
jgi:DNA-directed RNA polymerase omega subunit